MFQFVHVNSYSRTLSKKAKHAKWSARDVVAEATRDPSAIPHIEVPEEPLHVYGEPIGQLLETLDAWAEGTKDAKGRKTRKDAVCLLAGVFSVPYGTPPEVWEQVKKDSIAWAEAKYGDRLKTVIEHVDEGHPHCHFYVVPRPGEAFESVHEGRAAVKEFVAAGGEKKKTNEVYRGAMRGFQDEYYEAVGAANGMTRIGPGKRRLSREAWRMEQQQAAAIAEQHERARRVENDANEAIVRAQQRAEIIVEDADKKVKAATRRATIKAESDVVKEFSEKSIAAKLSFSVNKLKKENESLRKEVSTLREYKEKAQRYIEKAKAWAVDSKKYREIFPRLKALFAAEKNEYKLKLEVSDFKEKLSDAEQKIQSKDSEIEGLYRREIEYRNEVRDLIEKELKGDNLNDEKQITKKHDDSSLEY